MLKPCLECGTPCAGPRCDEHTVDRKPQAQHRGYGARWRRLSRTARRQQPFCSVCGTADDLQADHLPGAWERVAAGKPLRLGLDVDVKCGRHNREAGARRGPRGEAPSTEEVAPPVKAKFASHSLDTLL